MYSEGVGFVLFSDDVPEPMEIEPIAHIESDFKEKFGIPRQSNLVSNISRIVFEPKYREKEALRDLETFSHIWLLFDFSENHTNSWSPTVRPPRLGGNKRVGVFASRSPFRPNSIGLSSVRLLSIEHTENVGDVLIVEGADLLNGTPIYDIKPYIRYTDSHPDAISGFADKVFDHGLKVECEDVILNVFSEEQKNALIECLAQDPRPQYQDDDRTYTMMFGSYDISFTVKGDILTISGVRPL